MVRIKVIALSLLSLFLGMTNKAGAQKVNVGANVFASNIYGPAVCRADVDTAYSQHAYIYPFAAMTGIEHGDTIRGIEYYKYGTDTFTGNPQMTIWMALTDSTDYGPGNMTSWTAEISRSRAKQVFKGGLGQVVDQPEGYKYLPFDTIVVYDTTRGKNLQVMVRFQQYQRQIAGNIPNWGYDNNFSTTAYVSSNETKYVYDSMTPPDTTRFSQIRKPHMRLFVPRASINATLKNVYCLGQLATLMAPIDTIKFIVENTGKDSLINHQFEIAVQGANTFRDTVVLGSLPPFGETLMKSFSYKPARQGVDTLTVRSLNDGYANDDTSTVIRAITANILSHTNPFVPNEPGGIGFNGSSGDFIAKFHTDSNYINQISIGFSSTNQPFGLGIWAEDTNGLPGKLLYMSDTLLSNGARYVQPVLPKVQVRGGYFVGIRQLGQTNIAFQYESEIPVRPDVFYFTAPAGDTNWTPFSPGFDYNFDIQPRIQVAHDVAVLSINNPSNMDTFEFNVNDSIYPELTLYNYGTRDQNNPFDVVCQVIDQFGRVVYNSTEVVKIKADDSLTVKFKDPFSLGNYGDLRMIAYSKLPGDLARDNDTATIDFGIYVNYDVQIETFFDPLDGQRFEVNEDRVAPTVRVFNFGVKKQSGIFVTSRIKQGDSISRTQTRVIALDGGESVILAFDSISIPYVGQVVFEVFCWNTSDSFPVNDTARVTVEVIRSKDLGMVAITRPVAEKVYERNETFRPYFEYRNFGLADQDSVVISCSITDGAGQSFYEDTIVRAVPKLSTLQALFKPFTTPDSSLTLYTNARVWIEKDQYPSNDTMVNQFYVNTAYDLGLEALLELVDDSTYYANSNLPLAVRVRNIGTKEFPSGGWLFARYSSNANPIAMLDSVQITTPIPYGEWDTIEFASTLNLSGRDSYSVQAFLNESRDAETANDSLTYTIHSNYQYDLALIEIARPAANASYQLNEDTIKPQVRLQNVGIDSVLTSTTCNMSFVLDGITYWTSNSSVVSIAPNETVTLDLTPKHVASQLGVYVVHSVIQNAQDEYNANDSLTHEIRVNVANDVGPSRLILPAADTLLFANRRYAPEAQFKNFGDSVQGIAFDSYFEIFFNDTMVYTSKRSLVVNVSDSTLAKYDNTFVPTRIGTYTMRAYTTLETDQNGSNDTLTGRFTIDYHESVPDVNLFGIEVFPNPVQDFLHVQSDNALIQSLQLYNTSGALIKTTAHGDGVQHIKLDVTGVPTQTYLLKINTLQGSFWKKIEVN